MNHKVGYKRARWYLPGKGEDRHLIQCRIGDTVFLEIGLTNTQWETLLRPLCQGFSANKLLGSPQEVEGSCKSILSCVLPNNVILHNAYMNAWSST